MTDALVSVSVGGRSYPWRNVPGCKACACRYRAELEEALVAGYGPAAALALLGTDHGLTTRNVEDNLRADHVGVRSVAAARLRQATEARQADVVETGAQALVDYATFANAVLVRVQERLLDDEIQPGVKDGLTAARLLAGLSQGTGSGLDPEMVAQGLSRYMENARAEMSPEQWTKFGTRMRSDEVLRELVERTSPRP